MSASPNKSINLFGAKEKFHNYLIETFKNLIKVHKNNDIVIIGAGAAGFEVALALDENLKRKNIKNNIILLSKNSSVLNQFNKTAELIAKKNLKSAI